MPLPTFTGRNAAGQDQTFNTLPGGRQTPADSVAVVLSTDDFNRLNSIDTKTATLVGGKVPIDAPLLQTDATGQQLVTLLNTPADALPKRPLLNGNTGLTGLRINLTTAATTTMVAGAAGQTIRVHRMYFKVAPNAASGETVDICSGATILARFELGIGEGIVLDFDEHPYFRTVDGEPLNIVTSATVSLQGRLSYAQSA